KIVSENKYDSIGTRVWTLSNGAKVIVKPTTFKNDEIQFSAISWGGSSLYSDADFVNASNAAIVAAYGGMGSIDFQSMQKMFAGKNFAVSPSIAEYMQGFTGSSSPKDLATALEVLHGYFVAPRKDAQIFQFILQQYKVQLTNKNNDPASVFSDTVGYVMGNYNPRRKPLTVEMLNQLNLDRSFNIFKERFSNGGQFVFTFVGNVNLDSLKALTEMYIASLPASGVSDMYKDYGAAYPTGNISKTVKKGKESKASVQLFYTGNLSSIGELDELQLDQLTKAMGIKLRETLREDAGGVYGVGISGGINKEPKKSYSISVRFGCAPENVEKLIALVEEEIKQTKLNGVAQINIDKVKAEQTRSLENDVKENSYWRYKLEQAIFRGSDPTKILLAPTRINLIDVATTKALANKYFNEANKAKFVLLPE
ncbi:MAG: M16 family metallopeptidase, partial [Sediminibacterium sp.]